MRQRRWLAAFERQKKHDPVPSHWLESSTRIKLTNVSSASSVMAWKWKGQRYGDKWKILSNQSLPKHDTITSFSRCSFSRCEIWEVGSLANGTVTDNKCRSPSSQLRTMNDTSESSLVTAHAPTVADVLPLANDQNHYVTLRCSHQQFVILSAEMHKRLAYHKTDVAILGNIVCFDCLSDFYSLSILTSKTHARVYIQNKKKTPIHIHLLFVTRLLFVKLQT
jgi:hypothetical protein